MTARIDASRKIVIEDVSPQLDCGRYAVKREVGDSLVVGADIFKEGHDAISAATEGCDVVLAAGLFPSTAAAQCVAPGRGSPTSPLNLPPAKTSRPWPL